MTELQRRVLDRLSEGWRLRHPGKVYGGISSGGLGSTFLLLEHPDDPSQREKVARVTVHNLVRDGWITRGPKWALIDRS